MGLLTAGNVALDSLFVWRMRWGRGAQRSAYSIYPSPLRCTERGARPFFLPSSALFTRLSLHRPPSPLLILVHKTSLCTLKLLSVHLFGKNTFLVSRGNNRDEKKTLPDRNISSEEEFSKTKIQPLEVAEMQLMASHLSILAE